jgi:glycosyltransferase involved in cell wall biosynthesis
MCGKVNRSAWVTLYLPLAHWSTTRRSRSCWQTMSSTLPIIYTHHTHYPEYAKAYLKERVILPFLAKALSAWFANTCDAVIAPSPKIKTLLRAHGVQRPIHVLPTGIRLEQFKRSHVCGEKARRLRSRLGISQAAAVVLFVGRLGSEKNVDFLITSSTRWRCCYYGWERAFT